MSSKWQSIQPNRNISRRQTLRWAGMMTLAPALASACAAPPGATQATSGSLAASADQSDNSAATNQIVDIVPGFEKVDWPAVGEEITAELRSILKEKLADTSLAGAITEVSTIDSFEVYDPAITKDPPPPIEGPLSDLLKQLNEKLQTLLVEKYGVEPEKAAWASTGPITTPMRAYAKVPCTTTATCNTTGYVITIACWRCGA